MLRIIVHLLMAFTLCATVFFVRTHWQYEAPKQHTTLVEDFNLHSFAITQYSKKGLSNYRLKGETLVHFSNDLAIINTFHGEFHANPTRAIDIWHMTAQKGTLQTDNNTIHLQGDVIIKQTSDDSHVFPLTLKTSELFINKTAQTLTTQQPILITSPQGFIKGVGFSADLAGESLTIQSKVESTYVLH